MTPEQLTKHTQLLAAVETARLAYNHSANLYNHTSRAHSYYGTVQFLKNKHMSEYRVASRELETFLQSVKES
jgi:hypothetical protein